MHSSCGKVTAVFLLVIVFLTVARRYNSTHFPLVLLEKCEHILAVVFFKMVQNNAFSCTQIYIQASRRLHQKRSVETWPHKNVFNFDVTNLCVLQYGLYENPEWSRSKISTRNLKRPRLPQSWRCKHEPSLKLSFCGNFLTHGVHIEPTPKSHERDLLMQSVVADA